MTPPSSAPPLQAAGAARPGWVWPALALLVATGLAVIFLLPGVQDAPHPAQTQPQGPPAGSLAPADAAAARLDAERELQALLRQRARLELANAGAWGEPDWSRAQEAAAAADKLFQDGRYPEAAQGYARAFGILEDLEMDRPSRLAGAVAKGEQALAANDWEAAVAWFELALRIEPDEERALRRLERARVRGDLLRSMKAGDAAENAGDLDAAQAAYRQAAGLDAEYEPAAGALARVSAALADSRFSAAMSGALAALDAGQLSAAERALEEAARLRPGDPALGDFRQRLARARLETELDQLRGQARALAEVENWKSAADRYQRALERESNASFAREGLEQARGRIRVHERLDHYLARPDRLYSAQALAEAEGLLASVGAVPASEPRLRDKLARLRARVDEAGTPLPVVLRSDGRTEVTVYHVGRLGSFAEHRLELLPGDYTATGSRTGYRDVRLVFRVRPGGATPLAVDVRCEEQI